MIKKVDKENKKIAQRSLETKPNYLRFNSNQQSSLNSPSKISNNLNFTLTEFLRKSPISDEEIKNLPKRQNRFKKKSRSMNKMEKNVNKSKRLEKKLYKNM